MINFSLCSKAIDYEEPEDLQSNMSAFSQIGPPRNVSLEIFPDGIFVTWESPEYGHSGKCLKTLNFFFPILTSID